MTTPKEERMKTLIEELIGIIPLLTNEELKKFICSMTPERRQSIEDSLRESIEEYQSMLKKLQEIGNEN